MQLLEKPVKLNCDESTNRINAINFMSDRSVSDRWKRAIWSSFPSYVRTSFSWESGGNRTSGFRELRMQWLIYNAELNINTWVSMVNLERTSCWGQVDTFIHLWIWFKLDYFSLSVVQIQNCRVDVFMWDEQLQFNVSWSFKRRTI